MQRIGWYAIRCSVKLISMFSANWRCNIALSRYRHQARSQTKVPEGAKSFTFAMKSSRQGSNYGVLLYPKYVCRVQSEAPKGATGWWCNCWCNWWWNCTQCTRLVTGLGPGYSITSGVRCWCHGGSFLFSWWGGCPTNFDLCHTDFIACQLPHQFLADFGVSGLEMNTFTLSHIMVSDFKTSPH